MTSTVTSTVTNDQRLPNRGAATGVRPRGALTVPQGAALTIGAVLGTGVITLPAVTAAIAGPASIVSWVALVLLSIPLAATFAALGRRDPDGGGVATSVRKAFGSPAASAVGWCFLFGIPVGAPTAAGFAGAYVADTFGGGRATTMLTIIGLIAAVTAMNWFGLRVSGRTQVGFTAVLALLLLVATAAALPHADLGNLAPFAPNGWVAVGSAAAVLVWAFAGWEALSSLSGEYRNPGRDIPRATAIAVAVVGLLYLGVVITTLAVLGSATATSNAPLADLLAIGLGGPTRVLTTVVAVLLTLGALNAYFAAASRLGAALARDGGLPAWLAQGASTGQVPRRSLAMISTLSLGVLAVMWITSTDERTTVVFATGALTLVYVFGTAAALRLLRRGAWTWVCAAVSFVAVTALLIATGPRVLPAIGLAVCGIAYDLLRVRRTRRAQPARAETHPSAGHLPAVQPVPCPIASAPSGCG